MFGIWRDNLILMGLFFKRQFLTPFPGEPPRYLSKFQSHSLHALLLRSKLSGLAFWGNFHNPRKRFSNSKKLLLIFEGS